MKTRKECLVEAQKCQREAAATRLEANRSYLLRMAAEWRNLAQEAEEERTERNGGDKSASHS
jgi:hypothetical protein